MATVKIKSSGAKQPRPPGAVPWVEKYRPKSMDEVVHQEEAVKTLKKSMETGNLPHLLFYGPPGTGKTSTILALCRDLFGTTELIKQRVLELNASDERGIEVVRNKIKTFAQGQVSQQVVNGRQLPPFKLIILDEVDQMTSDAQNALRRVIEIYSHVTRFALLCNYVSKIIDPITSRCAKFRFQPLPHEPVKVRLESIVAAEKLMTDQTSAQIDLFLDALIRLSEGDLRKAITYLQSAYRLYGSKMSLQALNDIAGVVPEEQIRALFTACHSKSFKEVQQAVETLVDDGYSTAQVLKQLAEHVIRSQDIDDVRKSRALLYFAESDKALVDGADELLQLLAVTTSTMRVLQQRV